MSPLLAKAQVTALLRRAMNCKFLLKRRHLTKGRKQLPPIWPANLGPQMVAHMLWNGKIACRSRRKYLAKWRATAETGVGVAWKSGEEESGTGMVGFLLSPPLCSPFTDDSPEWPSQRGSKQRPCPPLGLRHGDNYVSWSLRSSSRVLPPSSINPSDGAPPSQRPPRFDDKCRRHSDDCKL